MGGYGEQQTLSYNPAWKKLKLHANKVMDLSLFSSFRQEPDRFGKYSVTLRLPRNGEILLDYSKNRLTKEILDSLFDLARSRHVEEARIALIDGEKIYHGDPKPSIRIAYRTWPQLKPTYSAGVEVTPEVCEALDKMQEIVNKVVTGQWLGYTGLAIRHVVNIAVGGAHVGPQMVTEALFTYRVGPAVSFVTNVDATHLTSTLEGLDPETTLFVLAGLDFNAPEEIINAESARDWLLSSSLDESAIQRHFIAVTNQREDARQFGLDDQLIISEGVYQKRYSLWSPLALSVALSIGMENYKLLLQGAHSMDLHFKNAPLRENIPVLLALIGIWYNNFLGAESYAILPYNQVLYKLPNFIRHLEMESNGKSITRTGERVDYQTAPVVWGRPGTDSQNAFHQLLAQGTRMVPCDFLAGIVSNCPDKKLYGFHHELLLSHFLGQLEALMRGKSMDLATAELEKLGVHRLDVSRLLPFKTSHGSRPCNAIVVSRFTPHVLGAIIAMYEHKTFTQGIIWDINAYDRSGSYVGTRMSRSLTSALRLGKAAEGKYSSSMTGLIKFINSNKDKKSTLSVGRRRQSSRSVTIGGGYGEQQLLSSSPEWQALKNHARKAAQLSLFNSFRSDPARFGKYSVSLSLAHGGEILLDYSKNLLTDEILDSLISLARSRGVDDARIALIEGDKIYHGDPKPSIRIAYRTWPQLKPTYSAGVEVTSEINESIDKMQSIVKSVTKGHWRGYTGRTITHVINISVGGAHVGPQMAAAALFTYRVGPIVTFVTNVDATHLTAALETLNPTTTLFVLAGIDFTAPEEILNADSAKAWILASAKQETAVAKHFIAVTNQRDEARKFGIADQYIIPEGVYQKRFSLWSPLAISVALSIGMDNYKLLLQGAHSMDIHFKTAPLTQNIPVLLALIGIWYNNFMEAESYAILPYNQVLYKLPAFVRHLDMESNGKSVTRSGEKVDYHTAPVVWGKPGTDSQHVFHQLLAQGTRLVPCDFIAGVISNCPDKKLFGYHHELLLSHFLGQLESFMRGKSMDLATAELEKFGVHRLDVSRLLPFKMSQGSRPCNAIVVSRFTPHVLGAIIAMYEHKAFTQGIIWDINAYERSGSYVGTRLSRRIAADLKLKQDPSDDTYSSSLRGLINFITSNK